jgi:histidinol-phosphatase (PHP family)
MDTKNLTSTNQVSAHGGHSGQFCSHASDSLEAIVDEYAAQHFKWVGITEHMPPVSEEFLYPDEIEAGLTAESIYDRFTEYFSVARALQRRHRDSLRILVGFETECHTGYERFAKDLRSEFDPDYIVGSVHHVRDIPIDGTPEQYAQAAAAAGGIEQLYCEYFDQQLQLLEALKPEVVGHFDLIRIWDSDYHARLMKDPVKDRIRRNLEKIGELGSILDFNLRAFEKGGTEPYVSGPILEMALELGIPCVPGDDSHGVAGVGLHFEKGIEILKQHGCSTDWPLPGN